MRRLLADSLCPEGYQQFAKFALVGVLNFFVSTAIFVLCYRYLKLGDLILSSMGSLGLWLASLIKEFGFEGINAAVAGTAAHLAGMVNSFSLNKSWTFKASGRTAQQLWRFIVLNAISWLTSTLILLVFVDMLSFSYLLIWLATIGITLIINFLGNKYWIFSEPARHRSAD